MYFDVAVAVAVDGSNLDFALLRKAAGHRLQRSKQHGYNALISDQIWHDVVDHLLPDPSMEDQQIPTNSVNASAAQGHGPRKAAFRMRHY